MNWYSLKKTAISTKYIDDVLEGFDDPNELPFNNVFGEDNFRTVIPLTNNTLTEVINRLESGETKSRNKYRVDIDKKVAYKQRDIQEDPRELRLGKVIKRELGKEYADQWARQVAGGNMFDPNYSIVISRHPIDVLRMSDFSNIRSCHSEGEDYFGCALAEAKDHGAIAYVVRNKDLKDVDINEPEIFYDSDRKEDSGSIVPISRTRLRRYIKNNSEYELMIPETHTYGKDISGFVESLTDWAYEKQKPEFEGEDINLDDFVHTGGFYKDTASKDMFNNFFNTDKYHGNTQHVGRYENQLMGKTWEKELNQILERNEELKYSKVSAEITEDNYERPTVVWNATIKFEFEGLIFNNNFENLSKSYPWKNKHSKEKDKPPTNSWKLSEEISKVVSKFYNDFWIEDVKFEGFGDEFEINVNINDEQINDPDGINYLFSDLADFEKNSYNELWSSIRSELIKMGILSRHPLEGKKNFSILNNLKNFRIYREGSDYHIISIPIADSERYRTGNSIKDKQILNEMYEVMLETINTISAELANQEYLFQEYAYQQQDFSKLSKPQLVYQKVFLPHELDNYQFEIQFNVLTKTIPYNMINLFLEYISIFDNNFSRIVKSVSDKMDEIFAKYTEEPIDNQNVVSFNKYNKIKLASNWYKLAKSYWTQGQVYTDSDENSYEVDILIKLSDKIKTTNELVKRLDVQLRDNVWGQGKGNISPEMVIDCPNKNDEYKSHFKDIEDADTEKPILIRKSNGEIIDGYHRLSKAYMDKDKTIPAKIIDEEIMAKAKIQDFVGKDKE